MQGPTPGPKPRPPAAQFVSYGCRGPRSTPKPLVTELTKAKAKLHLTQIFFLTVQEPAPPGLLKNSIDGQRSPATLQSTEVQILRKISSLASQSPHSRRPSDGADCAGGAPQSLSWSSQCDAQCRT